MFSQYFFKEKIEKEKEKGKQCGCSSDHLVAEIDLQ